MWSSLPASLTRAFKAVRKGTGTPLHESIYFCTSTPLQTLFFVRDASSIRAEDKSCDSTPLMQTYFQFKPTDVSKDYKEEKRQRFVSRELLGDICCNWFTFGDTWLSVSDLTTRGGNVSGSLFYTLKPRYIYKTLLFLLLLVASMINPATFFVLLQS